MDKAEIQIIIAAHKECLMPTDEMYLPVQVGAAESGRRGYIPDNIGDNISAQNHLYSELTGLYWAWKNLKANYIGLVHYRRYFKEPHPGTGRRQQILQPGLQDGLRPGLQDGLRDGLQPELQDVLQPELREGLQSELQEASLRSAGAMEISSEALQWQDVTGGIGIASGTLQRQQPESYGSYWERRENASSYVIEKHLEAPLDFRLQKQMGKILTCDSLKPMLAEADIILPRKRNYRIETLYSHYAHTHCARHLDVTREIIWEYCPKYLGVFDEVMQRTSAHMFNMMIMKRGKIDEYCSWLFPILEKLVERVDASDYDAYEARFPGRVSELMMDVWLEKCGYAYQELPVVMIGQERWGKKIKAFLEAKFLGKKYRESF